MANFEEQKERMDLKVNKSDFYYNLFDEARQINPDRFDEYTELLAYYEQTQNELPANQTNKPWVIDVTTPYAADAINIRAASLFSSDYVGELQPLSPEDVENIENLNNIYHMFWNNMQMDNKINDAILSAMISRESYVHIIVDDIVNGGTGRKNTGSMKGYFIDPASVLIDPQAFSFKEADYTVITERITKNQYKIEFGKTYETGSGSNFQPNERGEVYAGADYDTHQSGVLTKLTFYIKNEEGTIDKVVMVEKEIEKETTIPISCFPIAQLRWEKKIKSPYGISLMDRLLPLQKSINAVESATTTAALAFSSPSYAVRAGSGVNPRRVAELAGAPGAVFVVNGDPKNAIVPISNGSVDGQLINIRQDNREELNNIAGVSEQFLGDFGSSGNTRAGANESSARARIVEQRFLTNLEEFIEDLSQIIVEFATKAFEGETLYSRGEKKSDGKYDFKEFKVTSDLQEMEYNFYISMDVRTPYSKERTKMLLQELYQFERQYDAPVKTITVLDIIKQYNLPNQAELVERYQQLSNKDSQAKAELIVQWTTVAQQNGIDANIIAQGVTEIIMGKETPTIDKALLDVQQAQRTSEQAEIRRQQQLVQKQGQQVNQQMVEQESVEQVAEVTGDETFT